MAFKGLKNKKVGGKLGKKKKSKHASEDASPLMVDEEQPAPPSGLKSSKETEREEKAKQREKRRNDRDKRLAADADNKSSSKNKKKSKKPKLSREEQDAKDAKLGCCHKFGQVLVKIIHVIDGLIGLTFLVYGLLILTKFETPAMEAAIASLTFGSVMLFTSIMGVIGFFSKMCNRVGLVLSAYTAPLIALFYIFLIIALLTSPDVYFDYLKEHKDVLYLNDAEIVTLREILPLFYIILASLTAAEICRFMLLLKIRQTLVKYDSASSRILKSARSNASERSKKGSERSKGSSKKGSERSKGSSKQGSDRTKLTTPLLGNDSSDEDSDYDV